MEKKEKNVYLGKYQNADVVGRGLVPAAMNGTNQIIWGNNTVLRNYGGGITAGASPRPTGALRLFGI